MESYIISSLLKIIDMLLSYLNENNMTLDEDDRQLIFTVNQICLLYADGLEDDEDENYGNGNDK